MWLSIRYGQVFSRGIISRQNWVEIEIGEASLIFWQIGIGEPYPEFSLIFPGHFRSEKNWEKSREIGINQGNRDKSREIGENRWQSRLFPTYLELFKRSGWPSRLIPKCRDKSGRLKYPDLDFGSRLRRPPRSSSPISAFHYSARHIQKDCRKTKFVIIFFSYWPNCPTNWVICFGISSTEQLTTWAHTNFHLLLLKSSSVNRSTITTIASC